MSDADITYFIIIGLWKWFSATDDEENSENYFVLIFRRHFWSKIYFKRYFDQLKLIEIDRNIVWNKFFYPEVSPKYQNKML